MDSRAVLIIAASGRGLAASARRGGYVPLVVDYFGDSDTLALAEAHARLDQGLACGMTSGALDEALARVTARLMPCGLVYGSGFEGRPHLLAHLAQRWPLFGNSAETVVRLKDPLAFASLCSDLGIPHPETVLLRPVRTKGWLAKRKGGSGGSHVRAASQFAGADGVYYQREAAGRPISVSFLADGRGRALIIGLSTQWSAPAPHAPFRYGGAARPPALAQDRADALTGAVLQVAAAIPLVGLCSADFLVDDDGFRLLEINPRPGATLDIFEPPHTSLFALHIAACKGELSFEELRLAGAAAAAVAYSQHDMRVPAFEWPEWTADRPQAGIPIKAGDPLCTVHATGASLAVVSALIDHRLATILDWMHARAS